MSYTLKFFIVCSIYVCSCSTVSFSSPANSSHPIVRPAADLNPQKAKFTARSPLTCLRDLPYPAREAHTNQPFIGKDRYSWLSACCLICYFPGFSGIGNRKKQKFPTISFYNIDYRQYLIDILQLL